jgi:orotidine-5'-phosphate decarboxylase
VVALRVANHWNTNGNCCLVVGATYPSEAQEIRRIVGDEIPFLVPGVGSQGGDIEAAVKACRNSRGEGMIVSSSSGIIHASQGADFAERAGEEAAKLNRLIGRYRLVQERT